MNKDELFNHDDEDESIAEQELSAQFLRRLTDEINEINNEKDRE